jgi:uncharacterized protein YdeI (YjbR/CyaY-like superfamily)
MDSIDGEPALHFKDRDTWRHWLAANHAAESVLWLIHYNKASGQTGVKLGDAVEEAICYGWIDGKLKSLDAARYAVRYTPRQPKSVWSLINKERAKRLIATGRMTPAGLVTIAAGKRSGAWQQAYSSRKPERLPADLKAALMADATAWRNFQKFANSQRGNYIGWVKEAKMDATRQRRIGVVVSRAHDNKRPGE